MKEDEDDFALSALMGSDLDSFATSSTVHGVGGEKNVLRRSLALVFQPSHRK
jgi:hypothetical protein